MSSGVRRTFEVEGDKKDSWGDLAEIIGGEVPLYQGEGFAALGCASSDGSGYRAELERAIAASGGAAPAYDLVTCAALLADGIRAGEAPQPSNTGGLIRRVTKKEHGAKLHPPSFYRSVSDGSWVDEDVALFARLPQGGGGIDWLTFSAWGGMTDQGVTLMKSLRFAKDNFGLSAAEFGAKCAEVGLVVVDYLPRQAATFEHPFVEGALLRLADATSGKGRQFQPLVVSTEGLTVRYGARENSNNGGVICAVEVPGTIWLRCGEEKALLHANHILQGLGLVPLEMRSSRFDAAADIPGMDVQEFVDLFTAGNGAGAFKGVAKVHYGKDGRAQTFSLQSAAVQLVVYDKLAEVALDRTGEKLPLMIANRWGCLPEKAVRVEWRFKMSKVRAKPKKGQTTKYKSLRELFEGLGELLGWAMNTWARFIIRDGSKNTDRMPYCDAWVRVLHAFAFWSHRFGKRPAAKPVQAIPQIQLMKQASGTFAAALGSRGIVPEDEWTAWALMAEWLGPDDIVERCRSKAREAMCLRGVPMRIVGAQEFD